MKLIFEEHNNNAARDNEVDIKRLQKAYKEIFTSKAGKMVLDDLASISGMYRTNFVQNNMYHTSFLEGQRSLFLYICSHLTDRQNVNIRGNIDGNSDNYDSIN